VKKNAASSVMRNSGTPATSASSETTAHRTRNSVPPAPIRPPARGRPTRSDSTENATRPTMPASATKMNSDAAFSGERSSERASNVGPHRMIPYSEAAAAKLPPQETARLRG
jgi:hypothetical protein